MASDWRRRCSPSSPGADCASVEISSNAGSAGRPGCEYSPARGPRVAGRPRSAARLAEHAQLRILRRAVVGDDAVAGQDSAARRAAAPGRPPPPTLASSPPPPTTAEQPRTSSDEQEHAHDKRRAAAGGGTCAAAAPTRAAPRSLGPGGHLVSFARADRTLRGDGFQVVREARIGDGRGLEALHLDALARGEPGDRAEHRERWSPAASRCPPASPPAPSTTKPSGAASIRAPSPRRPSTTVVIRSDSLRRSSSAPCTTVRPLGERAQQRHQRQLVDRRAGPRRAPPRCRAARPRARRCPPTGSPPAAVRSVHLDVPAHPLQHAQQARARGVHAHAAQHDLRARARASPRR